MPPGPPRKPTKLKLIEGNPGHQRLNKREPQPIVPPSIPEPPEFLSAEAKAEWHRRAPELYRLGVFTGVDIAPLAAYCQAYGRWVKAEIALAEMSRVDTSMFGGMMMRTANGNHIQNPILGVAVRALEQMTRLAAEFGMTPASRSRINLPDEPDGNPLAQLLGLPPDRRA